jgi:hypothetical protein
LIIAWLTALIPAIKRRPGLPRRAFAVFPAGKVETVDRPAGYRLDAPIWPFLCHVADRGDHVLHGSGNPGITEFTPRSPRDMTEFGAQHAVYAAADGLWPIFSAILDREHVRLSMCNGCVHTDDGARYHFSISAPARDPGRVPVARAVVVNGLMYSALRDINSQP